MKIWVTGASGSLGMAVVEKLGQEFPQALVLAPDRTELPLDNSRVVADFVDINKPTHVFHLAAQVFGLAGHKESPAECLVKNTLIDNSVFSALVAHPPQWVYFASTVAAYGYPYQSLPLKETDWLVGNPHDSEYGYAMAKRHSLSYLEVLREASETKYVYALTTNLFGEGDKFLEGRGHVVISLLEKALTASKQNEKLEVWGSGNATRDFLSTDDAAILMIKMIDQHVGVVNLASGQEISIESIAEEITREFNISQGFKFIGVNEGITNRVCSIEKLHKFAPDVANIDSFLKLKKEIRKFIHAQQTT